MSEMNEFNENNMNNENMENQDAPVENQQVEAAQSSEEMDEAAIKKNVSVNANARANQIVKGRYKFAQVSYGAKKPYYVLPSKDEAFDRILRRTPREVFNNSDDYVIPLGKTCIETVICAYGLSYGSIYSDQRWYDLVSAFNFENTEENAAKIVKYLRAAASLKYLNVSGTVVNQNNPVEFVEQIQSVNIYDIVNYFCYMVR